MVYEVARRIIFEQVNNTKNELASMKNVLNLKEEELDSLKKKIENNKQKLSELEEVLNKVMA